MLQRKKGSTIIEASGDVTKTINSEGMKRMLYDINYSRILTKLIQEAGKHCKFFASDLFISWNDLLLILNDLSEPKSFTQYFGFRDHGVDGESFIKCRLESPEIYGKDIYKSIYQLDVNVSNTTITMKLYQVVEK